MNKQCRMVLSHIERHGTISQKVAAELYGIQRLGARIYDLKKLGYPIEGRTMTGLNRHGDKTHWTEYYLETARG